MKRIGLISDTHGYLDESVFLHFKDCDEVWHAGDFGSLEVADRLAFKKNLIVRGVYGNVDGYDIRSLYPEELAFSCEDVNVLIIHIGGYPPKYNSQSKARILFHKPALFITGHSHILKIMFDETNQCLYMNPGAAGRQGYHKVRTIVRFTIDGKIIRDCEVIELGKRG